MTLKEALTAFIRHLALASAVTLVVLMGIEWLMPGAVLPFVDVFDLLLPISVLLLIIVAREAVTSSISRVMQLLLVVLAGIVTLAIVATGMESSSLTSYLLMSAIAICLAAWVLATARADK